MAVCSRTRAGAQLLADEVDGVPAYDSLEELLRREAIDVVHVCTPNAVHADQALLALEHGAHVVCETPLATSTAESGAMLDALKGSDRIGAVAYHVRGYPLVEHMRWTVADGELGELRVVHGRYVCDDALLVYEGWRLLPESSGPTYVTADLGAHWLDLAEHVTGSRGGFTWDQESPNELLHRHAELPTQVVVKDPGANAGRAGEFARYPAGHAEGYGDAFRVILTDAYRAMAGEPHGSFPTFADGHRGMQVLAATLRSAADGGWVSVEN